ncbi:MAG: hypothetical protein ACHQT8_01090 [Chlamydiales bacterium]
MTVAGNFKLGPHFRPVVDTCLRLLNESYDQQRFIHDTLEPVLAPEVLGQVQGVFWRAPMQELSFESPLKKRKITSDDTPEGRALKAGYRNGVALVEREKRVISSCIPHDDEYFMFRQAEARAFERIFFTRVGFRCLRENTHQLESICSFLDIKDLLRGVTLISPEMNYNISQLPPRIWQRLSHSFALPQEIYWKEHSKEQTKRNFLWLRKMTRECGQHFQFSNSANKILDYAAMAQLPPILTTDDAAEPRRAFREGIVPVVSSVLHRAKTINLPGQGVHARMNKLIWSAVNVPGRPFFIYEAFFICGEAGDATVMETLGEALNSQLESAQSACDDNIIPCIRAAAESALRLAGRYGQLPNSIDMLFRNLLAVPDKCCEPMLWELIERDIKCTPHTLGWLLHFGASEVLEGFVKKGSVSVYSRHMKYYMHTLHLNFGNYKTGAQVLELIELLLKYAKDGATDDPSHEEEAFRAGFPGVDQKIFLCMADFCHDMLMEKVVSLGCGPDNSHSESNTLHSALTCPFPSLSPNDIYGQYQKAGLRYEVIATLARHGATINPALASKCINLNYQSDPMTRDRLKCLLKVV